MGIRSKTIISTVSRTKQRINREKHINHTEREGPRIEDGTKRETTDHWSGRKKLEWEKHLERLHALLGAKDLMLDQKTAGEPDYRGLRGNQRHLLNFGGKNRTVIL